jgi:tetratricopeptide (TPR) repeat protein
LAAIACIVITTPGSVVFSRTLREEAVSYRTEGYAAQRRGDRAGALSYYQKAAALDPTYAVPHNDLGVILEDEGRIPEARRAYQEALKLQPDYLPAHANLAMLYERMGKIEQALYHWLKRYQLGDPIDQGTARAEERLTALGFLTRYPGMKGSIYTRRRVMQGELDSHAQSLKDFDALSEAYAEWP